MAERTIIRGDSYGLRRPLFTITLVNESGGPFNLSGCTLRTTYKPIATSPDSDPDDTTAPIKHRITIAANGSVSTSNGLVLLGAASAGVVEEHLTATESKLLPLNVPLFSDIELTDQNGEVFTWISADTLRAIDGITNRVT